MTRPDPKTRNNCCYSVGKWAFGLQLVKRNRTNRVRCLFIVQLKWLYYIRVVFGSRCDVEHMPALFTHSYVHNPSTTNIVSFMFVRFFFFRSVRCQFSLYSLPSVGRSVGLGHTANRVVAVVFVRNASSALSTVDGCSESEIKHHRILTLSIEHSVVLSFLFSRAPQTVARTPYATWDISTWLRRLDCLAGRISTRSSNREW